MKTLILSGKDQITIPKQLRDRWFPGTRFSVEESQGGILLKPLNMFPTTDLHSGLGCAGYHGPARSVVEMDKGVVEDLRTRWQGQTRENK